MVGDRRIRRRRMVEMIMAMETRNLGVQGSNRLISTQNRLLRIAGLFLANILSQASLSFQPIPTWDLVCQPQSLFSTLNSLTMMKPKLWLASSWLELQFC